MLRAMDTQTIWILAATVSPPIAGVVGFAIQLRQVEKARLENTKLKLELEKLTHDRDKMALELTKLALEVESLQHQSKRASSRIVVATNEQIAQFNDLGIRFSRRRDVPAVFKRDVESEAAELESLQPRSRSRWWWVLAAAGIALLAALVVAYGIRLSA